MSTDLTDDDIDLIAGDGMRNAAGGIYASCVYEFARSVVAADRAIRAAPAAAVESSQGMRDVLAQLVALEDSKDVFRKECRGKYGDELQEIYRSQVLRARAAWSAARAMLAAAPTASAPAEAGREDVR